MNLKLSLVLFISLSMLANFGLNAQENKKNVNEKPRLVSEMQILPSVERGKSDFVNNVNVPKGNSLIILEVEDVWGDGTGYQLLLDETATEYDNTIPMSSYSLTQDCDIAPDFYDVFSHTIPENADPSCTSTNIVVEDSQSILIPSGVYDFVLVNPVPNEKIWIASNSCDDGRADDYTFEPGVTYHFYVRITDDNISDCLTITSYTSDPDFPNPPTNLSVQQNPDNELSAIISWNNPTTTIGGDPTTLTSAIVSRNGEIVHTIDNPSGASEFVDLTVENAGYYTYSVCVTNESGCSDEVSDVILLGTSYQMSLNQTIEITACSGIVYDNGGANGDYSNNSNDVMIIYPENEGTNVEISGSFVIENNYDFLYVYDGAGTDGTLMSTYTSSTGGTIQNAATNGPLTLHFTSDGSVPKAGFEVVISCSSSSTVYGNVATLDGNHPVADAVVTFNGLGGGTTFTDADGNYTIDIQVGTYDVLVEKEGYNDYMELGVVLEEDVALQKDFKLTAPCIELSDTSVVMECTENEIVTREVVITNYGNGPLSWNAVADGNSHSKEGETHLIFAINQDFYSSTLENIDQKTHIASVPDFINSATYIHGIYYFSTSTFGYFGIVDVENNTVEIISNGNRTDAIAYNPADGVLYGITIGGNSTVYTIDPYTGIETEYSATVSDSFILGFCFDNDGRCFIINATINGISEMDINTGNATTFVLANRAINAGQDIDVDRSTNTLYWAACGDGAYPFFRIDVENQDIEQICMLSNQTSGLALGTTAGWLKTEPIKGVLEAGESQVVNLIADASYAENESSLLGHATFVTRNPNVGDVEVEVYLNIISGDCPAPSNLTATVEDGNVALTWELSKEYSKSDIFFNVYRNAEKIASNVYDNSYLDENLDEGTYTYTVTRQCDDVESAHSNEAVAIVDYDGIDSDDSFMIYPNPADDQILVQGENVDDVEIYNAMGQLVEVVKFGGESAVISTKSYSEGLYFVKINTVDGNVLSKRLIIKH